MFISVINHTNGQLPDPIVQEAIRALNRQISEDFEPYWHIGGRLRLEGKSGKKPSTQSLVDMRGDAVLYLWDGSDIDGALGYHDRNHQGIPYGFVFTKISEAVGEDWTVTFSHEALELLLDPEVNLLCQGPKPSDPGKEVFHWYEACDAVQAEGYRIDGIEVSNFVLPLYFTSGDEKGSRNDFLGTGLKSFGVNPGGYVGYYDPEFGDHDTFSAKGDVEAERRIRVKGQAEAARRGGRHKAKR